MPKLTKRIVDAARPRAADYFVWCATPRGCGLRVYPSGKKIFVVQLRFAGKTVRPRIGPFGPFTVESARTDAEKIIREAAQGRHPRQGRDDARTAPSLADLCDQYLAAA